MGKDLYILIYIHDKIFKCKLLLAYMKSKW